MTPLPISLCAKNRMLLCAPARVRLPAQTGTTAATTHTISATATNSRSHAITLLRRCPPLYVRMYSVIVTSCIHDDTPSPHASTVLPASVIVTSCDMSSWQPRPPPCAPVSAHILGSLHPRHPASRRPLRITTGPTRRTGRGSAPHTACQYLITCRESSTVAPCSRSCRSAASNFSRAIGCLRLGRRRIRPCLGGKRYVPRQGSSGSAST